MPCELSRSDATFPWSSLPQDLQCKVLRHLPASIRKLRLRFVAKSWTALLDSPDSYSSRLEEGDNSLDISKFPAAVLQPMRAIGCYSAALHSLANLPVTLVELELWSVTTGVLNACAPFPHLTLLTAGLQYKPDGQQPLDPLRFPALRKLQLWSQVGVSEQVRSAVEELHRAAALRELDYKATVLLDLELPEHCEVTAELAESESVLSEPPASAAKHLGSLCVAFTHSQLQEVGLTLDLSVLHKCQKLRKLTIREDPNSDNFYIAYGCRSFTPAWKLAGLHRLPASLTEVIVTSRNQPSYQSNAVVRVRFEGVE